MLSLSILTVIGLLILKLSMNILLPRQWTLQQTLSDAYLTYEKAYAQRIPFEDLSGAASPWPEQPRNTASVVEIGRLPGGTPLSATVFRTRIADPNNPVDGQPLAALNPAAMKIWRLQSVLSYRVGTKTYVKSRTVVRAQ